MNDQVKPLTEAQKACAMDKLTEMVSQTEYCPIWIHSWVDSDTGSQKFNVTVDGWHADHEFETLEEAIVSAYETWKREWKEEGEES